MKNRTISVPKIITIPIVMALIVWYAAGNLNDIRRTLFDSHQVLADFNRELPELIGSNALVSGAYGPALTIENNLKGVYNYFGATQTTETFLETYPVTHLLVTSTDFESMKEQSPQMANAELIGKFFIRNYTIMLYRLADEQIPEYQPSSYEKAFALLHANQPDSVQSILERYEHVNECYQNIFSLRVRALFNAGNEDEAMDVTKEFADRYPDNYSVQLTAADLFGEMYTINSDRELLRLTDQYLKRARALNPHIKTLVSDLVN